MKRNLICVVVLAIGLFALPELAHATVQTTLENIGEELTSRILPLVAVIGIIWAGFSFFSGNPNAKSHVFLAAVGCAVGFGAKSIVALIQQLVQ